MTDKKGVRIERDTMGPMEVPESAYYGASTQRAVLNFPISSLRFSRSFIRALGLIKLAAAQTNNDLGLLDKKTMDLIVQAAQEVADGKFDEHFVVDIFQTGSGTSTNMNANEVIANRAAEHAGQTRGSKVVHPNDHVNKGQSSNDVIPTVIHLAALMEIQGQLIPALEKLHRALAQKREQFKNTVKTGRTHLQDATPITLGQEFDGYAGQVERGIKRAKAAMAELSEVALGGTAVGSGVNTHPEFASRTCAKVSKLAGVKITESTSHFQAQSTLDNAVMASGCLRTIAVSLHKIANDIRLLGSGPRAGLGELLLPEVQPGSSIMPGKVNPVIAEALIQVCANVVANDIAVVQSGQWSFFELNTMMPLAAYHLLQEISLLATASVNFADQCVTGIQATDKGPQLVEQGLMLATALVPVVGYDKAAAMAKHAAKTGQTIMQVAKEQTQLSDAELRKILDPMEMTKPGAVGGSG
ncbi:MAG: class II fumarate hydratase [Dehalococcoidia bacterium]|nr:class II fumarate hydratase [Dehalococcoidia bacterium]